MDNLDVCNQQVRISLEMTEDVAINHAHPEQKIKVGTEISAEGRAAIIQLLKSSCDVFALVTEDVEGISEEVSEHHLIINPEFSPLQQKAR